MTKARASVLIPDPESGHALVVARCLAEAGFRIVVLARNHRTALRYSRRVEQYHVCGSRPQPDSPIGVDDILAVYRRSKADILLPVDEPAHRFAIDHRSVLDAKMRLPPLASSRAFDIATQKDLLAQFLASAHIATPETISFEPITDGDRADFKLAFPLIAKPVSGHGGQGIVKINTPNELDRFCSDRRRSSFGRYILQQYIRGYDIDLSALCVEGTIVAHTIQRGTVARRRAFAAAGGVEFLPAPQLLEIASQAFGRLKFSGIAHVDARYDEDAKEFKLIEINARYWGSLAASLLAGVNFPALACRWALGEAITSPQYRNGRFIDTVTLAKRIIRSPFSASSYDFRLSDSDLHDVLSDPIAEVANIAMRRT